MTTNCDDESGSCEEVVIDKIPILSSGEGSGETDDEDNIYPSTTETDFLPPSTSEVVYPDSSSIFTDPSENQGPLVNSTVSEGHQETINSTPVEILITTGLIASKNLMISAVIKSTLLGATPVKFVPTQTLSKTSLAKLENQMLSVTNNQVKTSMLTTPNQGRTSMLITPNMSSDHDFPSLKESQLLATSSIRMNISISNQDQIPAFITCTPAISSIELSKAMLPSTLLLDSEASFQQSNTNTYELSFSQNLSVNRLYTEYSQSQGTIDAKLQKSYFSVTSSSSTFYSVSQLKTQNEKLSSSAASSLLQLVTTSSEIARAASLGLSEQVLINKMEGPTVSLDVNLDLRSTIWNETSTPAGVAFSTKVMNSYTSFIQIASSRETDHLKTKSKLRRKANFSIIQASFSERSTKLLSSQKTVLLTASTDKIVTNVPLSFINNVIASHEAIVISVESSEKTAIIRRNKAYLPNDDEVILIHERKEAIIPAPSEEIVTTSAKNVIAVVTKKRESSAVVINFNVSAAIISCLVSSFYLFSYKF